VNKKSALILGVSIILALTVFGLILQGPINRLSNSIDNYNYNMEKSMSSEAEGYGRYQMVSANENNIILLDTKTGKYWRKFIPTGKGPTDWAAENTPDFTK